MFGNLVEIAQKFWTDHVLPDRPPPLDHTDAAAEYLRRRFGLREKEKLRELDPASEEFMKAWGLATEIRS
jgi:predicted phage-related endonuclease